MSSQARSEAAARGVFNQRQIDNYGSEDDEEDSEEYEHPETNLTEQAIASIATEEDDYPMSDRGDEYSGRLADIYAFSQNSSTMNT